MPFKAVIFDYIGTLVNCRNYTMDSSKQKLYNALIAEGLDINREMFLNAYDLAHEKYRKVRYEQLREVTNAVWVSEALGNLGFRVTDDDPRIKAGLNIFFQDFIDTLELRNGAKKILCQTQKQEKVALISNFTYAPVIYKSLRKMGTSKFFNAVVVSQQVGWRKPSSQIFQFTLKCLDVQANEAVYIGDSPNEDIKGAKQAGLKTVFVPSQFNTLKDLKESKQEPDYIANDLTLLSQILNKLFSLPGDAQA
jgi:HAD superfamily hydrolase (TIGR01509 family)